MKLIVLFIRLLLGGIFIYAGGIKLLNPQAFADSIAAYEILPSIVINPLALGLPLFEILSGVLLILPTNYRRIGELAIIGMLFVFLGAIGYVIVRGLNIDCGCFGQSWLDSSPPVALIRDLVLLALSLALSFKTMRTAEKKDLC